MSKTLYLLRRPIDRVNQAVFLPSDTEGDVVLLEEAGSSRLIHDGGTVFSVTENRCHTLITYDDLVEKIFQSDHTIVI